MNLVSSIMYNIEFVYLNIKLYVVVVWKKLEKRFIAQIILLVPEIQK